MPPPARAIRSATSDDAPAWRDLRCALWPHRPADEHAREIARLLDQPHRYANFIAVDGGGTMLGFAEAALRHDYVNGCDTAPVIFLEGLYVIPAARRQRIAHALCAAVGAWGAQRGCVEFASDAALGNAAAHALHRALGFDETERVVFFRKRLGR